MHRSSLVLLNKLRVNPSLNTIPLMLSFTKLFYYTIEEAYLEAYTSDTFTDFEVKKHFRIDMLKMISQRPHKVISL